MGADAPTPPSLHTHIEGDSEERFGSNSEPLSTQHTQVYTFKCIENSVDDCFLM